MAGLADIINRAKQPEPTGSALSRIVQQAKTAAPPPDPARDIRRSVHEQTLRSMQRTSPQIYFPSEGAEIVPGPETGLSREQASEQIRRAPVWGGPTRAAEGAREMVGPGRTPLQRLGGATRMAAGALETVTPLMAPALGVSAAAAPGAFAAEMAGGAAVGYGTRKGLEAAGAPPEVAEAGEFLAGAALPIVGTARRLRGMLPSGQAPLQTLGGPRALLPPAQSPRTAIPTGVPEPGISMEVVPRTSPPTLVPPSRQLPPATPQMPAARLPEAGRPVAAGPTGETRALSLDDVRRRIAVLESEGVADPVRQAQIRQELGELKSYLEPQQPAFPIPEPSGRQGELWTGRRIDIKPESKVYGAGPVDEPKGIAQGELRRAEEAASRTLPRTLKTPKEYQPTLEKQLESIGFEARQKAAAPTAGVAQLSPETAATSYPKYTRILKQIEARDARIAKLSKEAQELQAAGTQPERVAALNKEIQRLAKTGPSEAESTGIREIVRSTETTVPREMLEKAQASTRPQQLGKGQKRRPYGESAYASAKYAGSLKTGQVFSKPDSPLPPRARNLVPAEANSAAEAFDTAGLRTTARWIDRFAALAKLERVAGGVMTQDSAYRDARLFAGFYGKAENRLQKLQAILPQRSWGEFLTLRRGKALDDIVEYAKLDRFDELAKRGVQQFEGGQDISTIRARRAALEQANPELPKVTQALTDYSNSLLKEAKESGIISEQTYQYFLARNEKYIPLERIMEVEDEVAKRVGSGLSVSRQNLYKEIGPGSTREVRDPIEALVDRTYRTIGLIERNKTARKLADLSSKPGFENLVVKVADDAQLPATMDRISVLKDGVAEHYAVPKPVADAMKGLNEEQVDLITRTMAKSGRLLRATATTYNPFFFSANIVRDFYTALYRSDVGYNPLGLDWLKGAGHYLGKTDTYKQYLESGGGLAGHYQRSQAASTARSLTRPPGAEAALTIVNPARLMRKIGELTETGTRVGVFNRALKAGRSAEDAALISRTASVDFPRRGSAMRGLNMWVPFLNARLQGTVNVIEGARHNPGQAALVATSAIMLPAAYAYYHNTRFHPDTWADIQQHEKDNYFIFIYGDKRDSDGNPIELVKIPKGEIGRMFGNPVQELLAHLDGYDSKKAGEVALDILGDLSPVGIPYNTREIGRTLSGISPPAPRAALEIAANRNLYTGIPLESETMQKAETQYRYEENPDSYYYASPWIVKMGKTFGISPMAIKHAVEAQFGGVGRMATNLEKSKTAFWSRFTKARGGAAETAGREQTREKDMEVETEKRLPQIKGKAIFGMVKDREPADPQTIEIVTQQAWKDAQEVVRELGAAPTPENYQVAYQQILEAAGEELEKRRGALSGYERDLKGKQVETRARIFVDKVKTLPPEERGMLQRDWEEKGILTPDVLDRAQQLWQ